ncbi:MAG: CDP-glucose 4,6-dehydratase [Candidatus Riflebacteria bacterium]|nr:CDP-glucose 4,6-dehydratase [Candidatus Riflebacteria bacterium]
MKNFFRNKNILVTGHTGFKGTWLSIWLKSLGAKVFGYSLCPPTTPSIFETVTMRDHLDGSIEADIRDLNKLKSYLEQISPDIVFHLAAQSLVRLSYQRPVETFETNVLGTVNVLEAFTACKSARICVGITSDKCYENRECEYAYRENDPMGGHDPYSASKGCAEIVASSWRRSYFPPDKFEQHTKALATARAGNVIGGGDWAKDRIIPDIIRSLSSHTPIQIRNPLAIRPWQHVLEAIGGYLMLAQKLWNNPTDYSGGWNFGPPSNSTVNVLEIAKKCAELWGSGDIQHSFAEKNMSAHEANFLKLDSSKATDLLGWKSVLNVTEAIDWTISWYKKFYAGNDNMFDCTAAQIKSFSDKGAL